MKMRKMSTRRSVPNASAPPKPPEVAKKVGSRLEHVLSVGMGINKAASVPATDEKFSFAMAHKAPIVNVGISMIRKTLVVVPRADIGVKWDSWAPGQEDAKVQKWNRVISQLLGIYPDNGTRPKIYELASLIYSMGNDSGIAKSGSVNRGYYIYLLQVFESALRSAQVKGSNDRRFAVDWVGIVRKVDMDTTNLAASALGDPTISNSVKENIFAYFDYVNKYVFNFFTMGNINIMTNPPLANNTSPNLTMYLSNLMNPHDEVLNGSDILRGMSSDPRLRLRTFTEM